MDTRDRAWDFAGRTLGRELRGKLYKRFKQIPKSPQEIRQRRLGRRVVINSRPKCGTNLVRRALELFPGLSHTGLWLSPGDPAVLSGQLDGLRGGQIATMHAVYSDETAQALDARNVRSIQVWRDPRDLVVSGLNYLKYKNQWNWVSKALCRLPDDEARLTHLICGFESDPELDGPNVPAAYAGVSDVLDYLPWRNHEGSLGVFFERLVGAKGGGRRNDQIAELRSLVRFLGLDMSDEAVEKVADEMWGSSSTFFKGRIGTWREYLTPEHRNQIKERIGGVLIDMGWERDHDW